MYKFGIMLLLPVLLTIGCTNTETDGKNINKTKSENVDEQKGEGEVQIVTEGNRVIMKSDKGNMSYAKGKDTKIPEDFPDDVYIYEDAQIFYAVSMHGTFSLRFRTEAGANDIINTYVLKMNDLGWKVSPNEEMAGFMMKQFVKEDRIASVTVTKSQMFNNLSVKTGRLQNNEKGSE